MIFDDEDTKKPNQGPKVLDDMSIDELKDYIEDLKAEIERVEQEITAKKAHNDAAAALFGK